MADEGRPSDGQSISRAVQVLRVLADQSGASLGQIAKASGLPRSTVQRLVNALNAEGLVTKTFGHQGVYLGMELARLGARVNIDARALLLPLMEQLHARIGDNLDLTTIRDGRVIVIEQLASHEAIRVVSYVGMQHPIHCTANGKAHLSMLPRDQALALLKVGPEKFTARTLTDPARILVQVEAFRATGFFVDEEEYAEGACAVAIALPGFAGGDLAISIAMPTHRYQQKADRAKTALLEFRAALRDTFGPGV